jgi:RNA polymerase sigma-70 factor (ECF subfamily)
MRRYNSRAFRAARAITRSDDEAEDVMQQAYLNAYANLAGFERRARFSTWLLRIVIHEALSRRRRDARIESLSDFDPSADDVIGSTRSNPESSTADRSLLEAVERLIDAMPEHYRTVLVLRSVEGLSVGETAAALQITEETVRTRLHRARGLLQDRLSSGAERLTRKAFDFHLSRCDRIVERTLQRITARQGVPPLQPKATE